jgi:hypothetical protein
MSNVSLTNFGFMEILPVAALGFCAYQSYKDNGNKFGAVSIILIAVALYMLYAGTANAGTSFAV